MTSSDRSIAGRVRSLGFDLPTTPPPVGNFLPFRREEQLLFLSGQGPVQSDGRIATGVVGSDVDIDTAYIHARDTALVLLAVLDTAGFDLDSISSVVKLLGFVNADPSFTDHPAVINGASDLLYEIFGEKGRHARSAIGVASLPGNITVEVEAVFAINKV